MNLAMVTIETRSGPLVIPLIGGYMISEFYKEAPVMDEAEPEKRELDGRRIYVHALSFLSLGQLSMDAALLVFNTLGRVSMEKIAHHQFEQAIEFDLVDPVKGLNVVKRLNEHYGSILTPMLRQIGYRPSEPARYKDFYPLLTMSEYVYDTCSEAGYFLFATGKEATKRMFEEKGSMHAERTAIREGKGPNDITWINGRNLALLRPDLPIGSGAAKFYFGSPSYDKPLHSEEFAVVKQQVAARLLSEVETVVRGANHWNSFEEAQVLTHLFATCRVTLTKGIFADRRM